MSDGQRSFGQVPYEPGYCTCGDLITLHVLSETTGKRTSCSNSNCPCKTYTPKE